jgi:hypothetical protein
MGKKRPSSAGYTSPVPTTPTHHNHGLLKKPKPRSSLRGLLDGLVVVVRGCLLLTVSLSINILNALVYLTIRPWSRVTARKIVCKCPSPRSHIPTNHHESALRAHKSSYSS